ncbi:MAG: dihydroneopterin aldolase [SAR86 cluster bacterium]|jgi:7,8-dihydroneopterin aldolase/epimerase/oxygenase|nr:dihydroneopterin aldolase [SAR86 cluster bacterium]
MDIIRIEELEIEAVIGIFDWEREVRQLISIDMEMHYDCSKPGSSDDISDALDYKAVSKMIISLTKETKSKLIEHLAEKISSRILEEFPVSSLKLTLKKPGALRGSKAVGLTIYRSK